MGSRRKEPRQTNGKWYILKNTFTPEQKEGMSFCREKKEKQETALSHTKKNTHTLTGFEILLLLAMKSTIFWDMIPCGLVDIYRSLRGMCCLLLAWHTLQTQTCKTSPNFYQTAQCHTPEDSNLHIYLAFEVLIVVVMKSSILWNITPCSLLKDGGNMFFCDAG
jgi:hypothetical protein